MGLLDDAIREHLELKRRRGADPTEVEREEREVLGPVRSRAVDAVADELEFAHPHSGEFDDEPLADEAGVSWANGGSEHEVGEVGPSATAFDHELLAEPGPDSGIEPEPPTYPAAGHEAEPYPAAGYLEREPYPPAGQTPAPHPMTPHEAERYPSDAEPSTAEYSLEDASEAEGHPHQGEKEDVLEETPEFLQDTPDHDRLWFEQRPPRDFDFDG